MWGICLKVDKKKQATVIALSLKEKAREAALELDIDVLNADNGFKELLD